MGTTYYMEHSQRIPVLFVRLSFDRASYISETTQFQAFDRWLSTLARTTRCCLTAAAGWDESKQHVHMCVECEPGEGELFRSRYPRFNKDKAWSHKSCDIREWDPSRGVGARIYTEGSLKGHHHTWLTACARSRRRCRRGECSCLSKKPEV